jgi:hypothetical protein
MAENQTVDRWPIAVEKSRHCWCERAVCEIGLKWQSRIEHDAGRAGGYLDASAPDLVSAAMDGDTHA